MEVGQQVRMTDDRTLGYSPEGVFYRNAYLAVGVLEHSGRLNRQLGGKLDEAAEVFCRYLVKLCRCPQSNLQETLTIPQQKWSHRAVVNWLSEVAGQSAIEEWSIMEVIEYLSANVLSVLMTRQLSIRRRKNKAVMKKVALTMSLLRCLADKAPVYGSFLTK